MKMLPHPVLITGRLILRPYETGDFEAVHAYASIPEVSQYMDWGPNTTENTRDFVARCVDAAQSWQETGFFFAVVRKDDNRLIGGCDMSAERGATREGGIGYCLHPDFWGRGYMTECAEALLKLGFEEMKWRRITSFCDPDNIGSWRVMEKVGMRREGHEREAKWFKGRWHDWLKYAILDHEWKGR